LPQRVELVGETLALSAARCVIQSFEYRLKLLEDVAQRLL
jgi:hypothetical protein